jgi:hypothetical protein
VFSRAVSQDDSVVKAVPNTIRFMSDGSMKTEQGWHLFGGSALTPKAARDAAKDLRVLVHHYGKPTEDVTGDVKRISAVLSEVTEFYDLFKYNAFLYSGDGAHKVLVIRWNH